MKELKFTVTGCGQRGSSLASYVIANIEGVTVRAVCDPYVDRARELADEIKEKYGYLPEVFINHGDMLDRVKPDAALIATSWETHIKLACETMRAGIPTAMEVGGAVSEEECWELVDTYEETKTPFMFMENCCFDRDELLSTAMARRGIFGKIMYCHGAYHHDLRNEITYGEIKRHYRFNHYMNRNCENYPTHEMGPIAKIIGINRGNRMVSLVSMTSASAGLSAYVDKTERIRYLAGRDWKQGDVVETCIRCENGELINLRLDTCLPGYYSREFMLKGTDGMFTAETRTAVTDELGEENCKRGNAYEKYGEYLPDIWKNITPEIMKAGHGGMDYFEFSKFVECLREGKEMPIDVYDAAAWMAITYLSEKSIAGGSIPVEIPDFTRGAYKNRPLMEVTDLGLDR